MSWHHARLNAARWKSVRRKVIGRDGWRCRKCGKAGRLEVDHVRPMQRDPDQDPYSLAGLQTLCRGCHIEKTRHENRRPLTELDRKWRALLAELAG